jgi:hypothetical protein
VSTECGLDSGLERPGFANLRGDSDRPRLADDRRFQKFTNVRFLRLACPGFGRRASFEAFSASMFAMQGRMTPIPRRIGGGVAFPKCAEHTDSRWMLQRSLSCPFPSA